MTLDALFMPLPAGGIRGRQITAPEPPKALPPPPEERLANTREKKRLYAQRNREHRNAQARERRLRIKEGLCPT